MLSKTANKNLIKQPLRNLEETCTRLLKLCNSESIKEGIALHTPIIKLGLHDNLYLNNNMLSLYVKCSGLDHARQFFDEMPHRDVVSWTGMLGAFVKNGDHEMALRVFDSMLVSRVCPNEFTLSSVLKSCSAIGELRYGEGVQGYMMKKGFWLSPILGSSLIDMYSKCGCVEEAYNVFREIGNGGGDVVLWTMMISLFAEDGKWSQALRLYSGMLEAGVYPNEFTFAKVLYACSALGLYCGKLIHAHMIRQGVRINLVLKTALVNMYFKFKQFEDAIKVSKQTPEYDVPLWTAIISGFSQNFKVREAISAFHQMQMSGILPNNYTYSSILNACSSVLEFKLGKQIHSQIIVTGFENDVSVGNAMVNMYMKCSEKVEDALSAFRAITSPNVISWTCLIAGLAEHSFEQYVFSLFMEMQAMGVLPNSFTISSVLGACRATNSSCETTKLHGYIIKTNADCDIVVGNALVDAYAGLGMVNDAWKVITMMSNRDAITYTGLATRMNQNGHHEMALNVIPHMYSNNIQMDDYSLATFISAAACSSMSDTGRQLHGHSLKSGLLCYTSVSNGLVDLYGKCGCINDMHRAFREIIDPDVVSWNNLISGLASNGYCSSALAAFDDMRLGGSKPDSVTLSVVLSACSHGGLVDLGLEYFTSISNAHDIVLQLDHYICLVDLLSRAGRLEEAINVIETMPFKPNAMVYKTLLASCKVHKNLTLGEDMARRGLALDPTDPAFYTLLANLYDDSDRTELGEKTRRLMRDKGLKKYVEQCWLYIRNKVHLFIAGNRSHPQIKEIYGQIKQLFTEFKNHGCSYHDNGDSIYHSEKLAVAYGLLSTPANAPIRVMKNVKICRDCHSFIMLVTNVVDREIIVKDGNRLHTFKKGECSCKGNW